MWPVAISEATAASVTITSMAFLLTALFLTTLFSLLHRLLWPAPVKVLYSPRKTSFRIASKELTSTLAIEADELPGARDVETPVS